MQPKTRHLLLQHPGIRKWYEYFKASDLYDPGAAERYLQVMALEPVATVCTDEPPLSPICHCSGRRRTSNVQSVVLCHFAPGEPLSYHDVQARIAAYRYKPKSVATALTLLHQKGYLKREGHARKAQYTLTPQGLEVQSGLDVSQQHTALTKQEEREANRQAILDVLQAVATPLNQHQLANRLGVTPSCIYSHLKVLQQQGLVRRQGHFVVRGKTWQLNESSPNAKARAKCLSTALNSKT